MQGDDKHNANSVPLPPDGTAGMVVGDRLGEVGVEGGGEGAFSGGARTKTTERELSNNQPDDEEDDDGNTQTIK